MRYKVELMDTALQDASEIRDYLKHFYISTAKKFADDSEISKFERD